MCEGISRSYSLVEDDVKVANGDSVQEKEKKNKHPYPDTDMETAYAAHVPMTRTAPALLLPTPEMHAGIASHLTIGRMHAYTRTRAELLTRRPSRISNRHREKNDRRRAHREGGCTFLCKSDHVDDSSFR